VRLTGARRPKSEEHGAATEGFEAVGEAGSRDEALEAVKRLAPDLVPISIDERVSPPSAAELGRAVPLVREQDIGPRLLRRLWTENGA
jgi:AmiR/NasT family two-component response regulator